MKRNVLFACCSMVLVLLMHGCAHTPKEETCSLFLPDEAGMRSNSVGTSDSTGPVAQMTERKHDFGVVREGGEYVHNFYMKNTGRGVLKIEKIIPA